MLAADVITFVRAALPPRTARLLEVGAGRGELAEVLRRDGYDVVAIDPGSETPTVRAVALHEVEEPSASFDAAVAVVSLHHVEPLAESCRRLGELVRVGGTLVVDEFDVELFDERAAHWLLAHRQSAAHEHREPADFAADLRDHIHPLRLVVEALSEWFRLGEPVRGPHLHRWELPPGLQAAEEQLIAAGRLPAIGVRLVGTRR
ncbi:hypothetical protein BH23ACT8_BH23ACT8_06270 [soil metagenome]